MVRTAPQRPQRSAGSTRLVEVSFAADLALLDKGTAQSATSTTIVLAETSSSTDDAYNNHRIYLVAGTGVGQSALITDYTGSTRTATVATWGETPDSTTDYEVREVMSGTTTIVEVTTSALTLASKAVTTENVWIDGERVIPGQAVEFTTTGGTAGVEYTISITATTSSSQTLVAYVIDTVV